MQRAALYLRVSTDEQALHGFSLEAQRETLTKYAHDNDFFIVDYYTDDGYTASKLKRPALQRMLQDIKDDKIDIIIFTKLDRWFRSVKDYYKIQEVLEKHKVNWKTVLESYDSTTSNGRLHINIMLSVAEDEVSRTSDRIKAVFESKIQRGEVVTGSVPLGLKIVDKHLVHDTETVDIVRDIFDHYQQNQSKHSTLIYIQNKYDIGISAGSLRLLFRNKLYIGERQGNPNYCEPIISTEQFNQVQEISEKNNIRRNPTGSIFIFTGLITCAECNGKMTGNKTLNRGKLYFYFRCPKHFCDNSCMHKKTINEKIIENYLLENIIDVINTGLASCELEETTAKKKPAVDKEKIRRKLSKLKDLYVNEVIDLNEYKRDYDMYVTQLAEIPDIPEAQINTEVLKAFAASDFKSIYPNLSKEEKRSLWRKIIKEIRIDQDNNMRIFLL